MSSKEDSFPVIGLSEIMDIQGGAQPPASTFKDALEPGYVRFVQIRDFETDAHLTYIQQLPKWRYCSVDDVLIARYGASVGRICRGVAGAYNVALAKVIPKGGVELGYLYYLLKSDFFQEPIAAMSGRSAQAGFNKDDLAAIRVPVAPLKDQREIAALLGCFDDRISVLRETNATLEAIAQALFKSWFVDFEPVRAKMAGRAPEGMDEATAALFPDALEETELGLLPSGWRSGCLGDVAKTFKRAVTPSDLHAGVNYVGLEHIPRKSLTLTEWGDAAELESNKAIFNEGDILFGKLRPYFHKVVVAPTSGVCSTDILVCQPTQAEHRGLATMYLFSDALISYADRLSNGAKMPRVNWSDLAKFPIAVPSLEISSAYTNAIEPLVSRMSHNTHVARTLATIRDTLLPRLISGQLRLPEAQAQLEPHLS